MANSVFHNIFTEKYNEALNNVAEENYSAMSAIKAMYLSAVISTFKWGNLPKNTLAFAPERYLCYWGTMSLSKNERGEKVIFPAYPSGRLMPNGEYEQYTMISMNGETWRRNRDEIALCYNNALAVPSIALIDEFATKSTNALRAVDNALERSMIPVIFECTTEDELRKLSDLYDRTKNGLPFRTILNGGFKNEINAINSAFDSRQYDIIAMWDVYTRYRNMFYTSFGINNIEIQKRERLTEAEGSGNDEITRYTLLDDMYERREEFVAEAKERFNVDITVELNRDSATVYNLELNNAEKIDDIQLNIMRGINVQSTSSDENVNDTDIPREEENYSAIH